MYGEWINEIIKKGISELDEEKKLPGWFSLTSISNIPFISYPNFSEEECKEVQIQTKNVLRISRNENNYKEVSILYNKNNIFECFKILGDFNKVDLTLSQDAFELIRNKNKNKDMVLISIHNHPNNSKFSLSDLIVFAENLSIKLMQIVNTKGEISFLLKPDNVNLKNIVISTILNIVPDYKIRIENNNNELNLLNLLSSKEKEMIVSEIILQFCENNVIYFDYLDKKDINTYLKNKDKKIEKNKFLDYSIIENSIKFNTSTFYAENLGEESLIEYDDYE